MSRFVEFCFRKNGYFLFSLEKNGYFCRQNTKKSPFYEKTLPDKTFVMLSHAK